MDAVADNCLAARAHVVLFCAAVAVSACTGPRRAQSDELKRPGAADDSPPPPAPEPREVKLERSVEPTVVPYSGRPRDAYDAALRALITRGFEVTFADPSARVLRAERSAFDAVTTARMEKFRREKWDELSRDQQYLVIRQQEDRRARMLSRGGATWHRRLRLSIAFAELATVAPVVEQCEEFESQVRCGSARPELRQSEEDEVDAIVKELSMAPAPRAREQPATEM